MATEMLEDIRDRSQSHLNVNQRDALYKIRDCIKQRKPEWKGALKSTRNMGKGLYKVFKTVVKEILQDFPLLGEPGSEFSLFIPETRNFAEVKNIRRHKETQDKDNSKGDQEFNQHSDFSSSRSRER